MKPADEPRLARVAAAIADPTRARTLALLLDGRLHTAGELAAHAGVGAATMSAHLRLLVDEGLATVRPQGRHRYFGLADGDVAHALEALLRLADTQGARARPAADIARWQRPALHGLRHARTCYGHLAGELGVRLRDTALARGWVALSASGDYAPTAAGTASLGNATATPVRGRLLYNCVDWSERRDHFAGPLAAAWLSGFVERGWLVHDAGSRALRITPRGQQALVDGLLAEPFAQ